MFVSDLVYSGAVAFVDGELESRDASSTLEKYTYKQFALA